MFRFELVRICKNMNFKGWAKLSTPRLNRYVNARRVQSAIRIQRFFRKHRPRVNETDVFTLRPLKMKTAFAIYEDGKCFLFQRETLRAYIRQTDSEEKKNPYTNRPIAERYICALESE